jgi:hypothetical protein
MKLTRPGASAVAVLDEAVRLNVDVRFRVKSNKIASRGGQLVSIITRRTSAGTQYQARLRFARDGSVRVSFIRLVGGRRTVIAAEVRISNLVRRADKFLNVRVRVRGTQPTRLAAKAWRHGAPEPTTWSH